MNERLIRLGDAIESAAAADLASRRRGAGACRRGS